MNYKQVELVKHKPTVFDNWKPVMLWWESYDENDDFDYGFVKEILSDGTCFTDEHIYYEGCMLVTDNEFLLKEFTELFGEMYDFEKQCILE